MNQRDHSSAAAPERFEPIGAARAIVDRFLSAGKPTVVADDQDRLLVGNDRVHDLLGLWPKEHVGRPWWDVTEARDVFGNRLCPDGCAIHDMIRRGEPLSAFDVDLTTAAGETVRVRVAPLVVVDRDRYLVVYQLAKQERRRRVDRVLDRLLRDESSDAFQRLGADRSADAGLTRREREVLRHLASGESTEEIAAKLFISPTTVRNHVQRILSKLDAHSRIEAVATARRIGVI